MVEELYTPEQLDQIHQQLWQCVLQFANVSATQERNQIVRDLHDSLRHALTALNFQLQTAIKLSKLDPTNQTQEFLKEAHRLVALTTQEVRRTVKRFSNEEIETLPMEGWQTPICQEYPTLNLDEVMEGWQTPTSQEHPTLSLDEAMEGWQTPTSQEHPTLSLDEPTQVRQTPISQEQPTLNLYNDVFLDSYDTQPTLPHIEEDERDYISGDEQNLISEPTVTIGEWQTLNLNEWHNLTLQKSTFFVD